MSNKKSQISVYLPFHLGSGNRGCEAITRATASMLKLKKEKIHVLTDEKEEDIITGLDQIVRLEECRESLLPSFFFPFLNFLKQLGKMDISIMLKHLFFLCQANRQDIVMITGGDLYCYPEIEWELRWVCWLARCKGCKLILWGCSIDEERISKKLIRHLSKYDAIYVREKCTKNILKHKGISKIKQISDPAFNLAAVPCPMPQVRESSKVIGINISNFTNGNSYSVNTIFYKNILCLIRHILEEPDQEILLIPHVFWEGQDDRILLRKLNQKFQKSGRVHLLDSEKLSYCQIRYIISRCYLFIGSRTHSVISSYAMKVPALALGYSIKSKGIAMDLELPEELVVDCKNLKNESEITDRYCFLEENYLKIKKILTENISDCRI